MCVAGVTNVSGLRNVPRTRNTFPYHFKIHSLCMKIHFDQYSTFIGYHLSLYTSHSEETVFVHNTHDLSYTIKSIQTASCLVFKEFLQLPLFTKQNMNKGVTLPALPPPTPPEVN